MVNKWFIVIKFCTRLIHVYIEFSILLWLLVCCKDPIKKLLLHQFLLVQYYRYLKIQISLILWPHQHQYTMYNNFFSAMPNQFQLSPSPCIVCILFKYVNPLGPKRVQHQFSPNNISRSTRVKVMRITKLMTKGRITLILKQILSTILKRNVWRSVWRNWIWILGFKGLREHVNLRFCSISLY